MERESHLGLFLALKNIFNFRSRHAYHDPDVQTNTHFYMMVNILGLKIGSLRVLLSLNIRRLQKPGNRPFTWYKSTGYGTVDYKSDGFCPG